MRRFTKCLEIGAVRKVRQTTHQFLSNLFLVREKDRGPASYKSREHLGTLQNASLHCLKFLLQENNVLCKKDDFNRIITQNQLTFRNIF